MKELFKNWAGVIKVFTYFVTLMAFVFGYLPVGTVVTITLIISGIAKIAEIIVGMTPSVTDDEKIAEIIKILKEKGIIKT